MTRDIKIGIVVTCCFLSLVTVVVITKMREKGPEGIPGTALSVPGPEKTPTSPVASTPQSAPPTPATPTETPAPVVKREEKPAVGKSETNEFASKETKPKPEEKKADQLVFGTEEKKPPGEEVPKKTDATGTGQSSDGTGVVQPMKPAETPKNPEPVSPVPVTPMPVSPMVETPPAPLPTPKSPESTEKKQEPVKPTLEAENKEKLGSEKSALGNLVNFDPSAVVKPESKKEKEPVKEAEPKVNPEPPPALEPMPPPMPMGPPILAPTPGKTDVSDNKKSTSESGPPAIAPVNQEKRPQELPIAPPGLSDPRLNPAPTPILPEKKEPTGISANNPVAPPQNGASNTTQSGNGTNGSAGLVKPMETTQPPIAPVGNELNKAGPLGGGTGTREPNLGVPAAATPKPENPALVAPPPINPVPMNPSVVNPVIPSPNPVSPTNGNPPGGQTVVPMGTEDNRPPVAPPPVPMKNQPAQETLVAPPPIADPKAPMQPILGQPSLNKESTPLNPGRQEMSEIQIQPIDQTPGTTPIKNQQPMGVSQPAIPSSNDLTGSVFIPSQGNDDNPVKIATGNQITTPVGPMALPRNQERNPNGTTFVRDPASQPIAVGQPVPPGNLQVPVQPPAPLNSAPTIQIKTVAPNAPVGGDTLPVDKVIGGPASSGNKVPQNPQPSNQMAMNTNKGQGNSGVPSKFPIQGAVYRERQQPIGNGDTFESLSKRAYGTNSYATALKEYNMSHPAAGPSLSRGILQPGESIMIPDQGKLDALTPRPGVPTSGAGTTPMNETFQRTGFQTTQPVATIKPSVATSYGVNGNNETFYSIAKTLYGSGDRWAEIYEMNKDRFKSMDVIPAGTFISVPPAKP